MDKCFQNLMNIYCMFLGLLHIRLRNVFSASACFLESVVLLFVCCLLFVLLYVSIYGVLCSKFCFDEYICFFCLDGLY